ncbi:ABC transporter permease [Protaetiibacter sp. 10F1B-8-1]|uniref:ABC transporter permease n=2 Tax=Protaetiibacter mangrovi TaxID=2970926 RepID=A0ABT1ZGK4_9MICO|nr:ABC transporter permease [Protaetiibacter mangrovi]
MALGLAGIAGLLLVWELVTRTGIIDPRFLPPASEVLVRFASMLRDLQFWREVGETMTSWAIGLAIAVVAGTIAGFAIGSSRFLERATRSTIEFLRPIPSVALIPLAVLLFGTKMQSSLLLIVYASFWQVLIQVIYGTLDVDPVANETARSYRLGRLQRIRHVVWPTTLPYLITGIRLAASVALILAITAELIIGTPGLGKAISDSQSGGDVVGVYAYILATGLIGVLVNLVARLVERRTLAWHTSIRSELAL